MPKFNAGLPVGVHVLNWEFSATSGLFGCDMQKGGCPGTYGMKISVCELECELDTEKKHAGNAVLVQDSSHTFQVRARFVAPLLLIWMHLQRHVLRRSTMATRLVHLASRAPNKWRRSSRGFSASFISTQLCSYMSLRELLAASLPLALNTLTTLTIMATFTTVSTMPAQRV
jgi:hypothetical protein